MSQRSANSETDAPATYSSAIMRLTINFYLFPVAAYIVEEF